MRLLAEEGGADKDASENSDQELALSTAVDAMARSMEEDSESSKSKRKKQLEYENECREKLSTAEVKQNTEAADAPLENSQDKSLTDEVKQIIQEADVPLENQREIRGNMVSVKDTVDASKSDIDEQPVQEARMLSYQRKITVLYEILSACLADRREDNKKCTRRRKGYDARHRVALRLLATWLDVKWIKMVSMLNLCVTSYLFQMYLGRNNHRYVRYLRDIVNMKRYLLNFT